MKKKVLFIHLDGALFNTSPATTMPGDSLAQLELMPGVIRNLYFIRKKLDFELVLVAKQDRKKMLDRSHAKMLKIFANEAIIFDAILELPASPDAGQKEAITFDAMLEPPASPAEEWDDSVLKKECRDYLAGDYDLANSFVIGVDERDIQLAETLGCKGVLLTTGNDAGACSPVFHVLTSWDRITELLFAGERRATVQRTTKETDIAIRLDLDGNGVCDISTGIGFFDHLLEQIGKHSGIDLMIKVKGDLFVDEHHTIEDTAIALGEAIHQALGSKRGIERYGYCLPMDDCLCTVALDFGGRAWLVWDASFTREKIGDMPTEMLSHFFKSFSDAAKMNLHIKAEGENEHHKAEGIFKALAKAMKMAVKRDIYHYNLPTTKGALS